MRFDNANWNFETQIAISKRKLQFRNANCNFETQSAITKRKVQFRNAKRNFETQSAISKRKLQFLNAKCNFETQTAITKRKLQFQTQNQNSKRKMHYFFWNARLERNNASKTINAFRNAKYKKTSFRCLHALFQKHSNLCLPLR